MKIALGQRFRIVVKDLCGNLSNRDAFGVVYLCTPVLMSVDIWPLCMALSSPKRWTNDARERTRSVTCPASTWQLKWDATANLDEEGGGHEVDDTWMQACHSRLKS